MGHLRLLLAGLLLIGAMPVVSPLFEDRVERTSPETSHRPLRQKAALRQSVQDQVANEKSERSAPAEPDRIEINESPESPRAFASKKSSLDEIAPAQSRRTLLDAIDRAQKDRGLSIDPRIIEILQVNEQVPIIVGGQTGLPEFQDRLSGTRHASGHRYRHIPFAALEAGPQALLELIDTYGIDQIELDERHRPTLTESVPLIYASQETENGFDGTGYTVAIIDTGVDTSHPIFQNRIEDEACFSRQGDCPGGEEREFGPGTGIPCTFGCGHGTLVAGIALGMDEEGTHHGIARNAGLVSIQVFSDAGGEPAAWTSDILAGLEHIYDLSFYHSIAAVSMSLGGEIYSSQSFCDQANSSRKAMIDQLRSIGIPTIVSSGNDGDESGISSPACISSAISVGSTRKNDAISSYSNSADFLTILAPGHHIRTRTATGGFATVSGTSMATPHVSGSIAVIREAAPESSLEEILFALQFTGMPVTDSRNDLTFPRIDVDEAIAFLLESSSQDGNISEPDDETSPQTSSYVPPDDSDSCGLIGLEIIFPLILTSSLRRGRRRMSDSRLA
ncbi:MAG: S8 family serine peptidase [Myxococcota bacterium]|nr:S8 family serine peptidase [Myxococcota bacterium]